MPNRKTSVSPPRKPGLLAILGFLRPYPGATAACITLLLINLAIEMSLPRLVGDVVNGLRKNEDSPIDRQEFPLIAGFLVLVLLRAANGLVLGPIRNRLVQRVLVDIRAELFDAIQRLPFSYHDRTNTGELISRSTADVWRLQDFLFASLFLSVDITVALVATTTLIFLTHANLGFLALLTLVPTVGLIAFFAAKLQPRWREIHDLHGKMTTVIQENIAGVRVVKAFAREESEVARFLVRRNEFLGTLTNAVNYWAARVPFAQFIHGLSIPLTLWFGGTLVLRGELTVGALTSTVLYLMAIGHRMGAVGQFTNILQNAKAAAERVVEIIDTPRTNLSGQRRLPPAPDSMERGGLSIDFQEVSFAHVRARNPLDRITFHLQAGSVAAIVGPTGSGKSSLVSLIPRLHETTSGTIRIAGIPIRDLDLAELRQEIGIVFQETYLFSETIRENIAYASPDASLDRIEAAASAAEAHDFIKLLPQGYDTLVGERGVSLSGGQKQRIAMARAFLCNPRILILDDATASIDAKTEHRVQNAMKHLRRGRTTFIIAHRLSSVQHADQILVLNEGKLVATGTHEDLITSNVFYQSLCTQQLH